MPAPLAGRESDEIILSTLPQPVSRWLSMNLPRELQQQLSAADNGDPR